MKGLVVITDRGGHLHNTKMLLLQMGKSPEVLITTYGPDVDLLHKTSPFQNSKIIRVPYLFSWFGKLRLLNPFKILIHVWVSFYYALLTRPTSVLSLGGSNVVFFCYFAKSMGAKIFHIECMNQVTHKSITARLLYPICTSLYVQWHELKNLFGPKAEYAGWVL